MKARKFNQTIILTSILTASSFTYASNQEGSLLTPDLSIPASSQWSAQDLTQFNINWVKLQVKQLPEIANLLQDSNQALEVLNGSTGHGLASTRFQQFYKGLEVVGAGVIHHNDQLTTDLTNNALNLDLNTIPAVSSSDALAIALANWTADGAKTNPELKVLPLADETSKLVYSVSLQGSQDKPGAEVLLDAQNGKVIAVISNHMELAPVNVYLATSKCEQLDPSGSPIDVEVKSCKQVIKNNKASQAADTSARKAGSNSVKTLRYYMTKHGRDGFDGKGSNTISVVHIGEEFANAYWDSEKNYMAYGDGDGKEFGDFTLAVDVAGHEMTHGVTSQTADLTYMDESGALNEAFSDFFGVLISGNSSWAVGKELYLDQAKAKGLRDLSNPKSLSAPFRDKNGKVVKRPYPAHVKDRFTVESGEACTPYSNDNCWVHVNSTIPGHAMYQTLKNIGQEKAEKLYYVVLTQYLGKSSNFAAFSKATKQACSKLFDSSTCSQVSKSLAVVGI